MTKFQALFILLLRHDSFYGCSWRALAGNYLERYTFNGDLIPKKDRVKYTGVGGNQIDGMYLEKEAFEVLLGDVDPMIVGMGYDLFECDLTYINANLKRHIK